MNARSMELRMNAKSVIIKICVFYLLNGCANPVLISNLLENRRESEQKAIAISNHAPLVIGYNDYMGLFVDGDFEPSPITLDHGRPYTWETSPDSNKVAIISMSSESSISVLIIDIKSRSVKNLGQVPRMTSVDGFSIKWSPNSDEVAVGHYSYRDKKRLKGEIGSISIFSILGNKRSLNCISSNSVVRWMKNGNLIVSNGSFKPNSYFIVDSTNCHTKITVNTKDKNNVLISPNDDRMLFYRTREVDEVGTGRILKLSELFISDINGKNENKIVEYRLNPKNAVWSPSGKCIAMDIDSQEYGNIRHIAIYDLATNKLSAYQDEDAIGIPNCEGPIWSPDGKNLFYTSNYLYLDGFGNFSRVDNYVVVRDVETDKLLFVGNLGLPIGWIGNKIVCFSTNERMEFKGVDGKLLGTYRTGDVICYMKW